MLADTVLHTDSAKAYRRVGPLAWPETGVLQNPAANASVEEICSTHKYVHTTVVHKRKLGQSIAYALRMTVRHSDGSTEDCKGGTQKIDGFWTGLRNNCSRRGLKTAELGSEIRERLHALVREYQFHYWHQHKERFELFGASVKEMREKDAGILERLLAFGG